MRRVGYGGRIIEYTFEEKNRLKSHYITVDAHEGVVLKGSKIESELGDRLVLKKAKWILDKLQTVRRPNKNDIVTGSRLPYLGKNYYVQVKADSSVTAVNVSFNESSFKIQVNPASSQNEIRAAIVTFYKEKATEKITPRVSKIAARHEFEYKKLEFRTMRKRWGSCTPGNKIILNPLAVKLPYQLIDYIILHELTHTKIKDHSRRFWSELSKRLPNWKDLDRRVQEVKL